MFLNLFDKSLHKLTIHIRFFLSQVIISYVEIYLSKFNLFVMVGFITQETSNVMLNSFSP